MKSKSILILSCSAAASVPILAACGPSEGPINDVVGAEPQAVGQEFAVHHAASGQKATDAEVAKFLAFHPATAQSPAIPSAAKLESQIRSPLATAAALPTCTDDFNQSGGLSYMSDHAYSTFATWPYYIHHCNGYYWIYSEPVNLDHFHLVAEAANQCYGTSPKWGTQSGSNCINQSDAMYWPRKATNMGGNTGVRFYVKSDDNQPKNFNLGAIYVYGGSTVDLWAYRVGVGWWHWNGLSGPGRWYFPVNNTNISEVQVFDNVQNGTIVYDNLEVAIIP